MKSSDQQNAEKLSAARSFLTDLIVSAVDNDYDELRHLVVRYVADRRRDGDGATTTPDRVLSEFRDGNKRTAVHFAAQSPGRSDGRDENDVVLRLLSSGLLDGSPPSSSSPPPPGGGRGGGAPILRLKDTDGLTPLMLAAQNASVSPSLSERRINAILTVGSTKLALARSRAGATALHYAAGSAASPAILDRLYGCGAVALATPSKVCGLPVHWAASASPPPSPSSPSSSSQGGRTEEEEEESRVEAATARLVELHESSCDPAVRSMFDAKNAEGMTPLLLAVASRHDGAAEVLVRAGADRTSTLPGGGGHTSYHVAADGGLVRTLGALLEMDEREEGEGKGGGEGEGEGGTKKGKRSEAANDDGRTPLDLAAAAGHRSCVALLLPGGEADEEEARRFIEEWGETNGGGASSDGPESTEARGEVATETTTTTAKDEGTDGAEAEGKRIASSAKSKPNATAKEKEKAAALKAEGNARFAEGRYDDAIASYDAAIDTDPSGDAAYYSNRSACLLLSKRYDEALVDGYVALELRPGWPKAYYRVASALFERGDYVDAASRAFEGLNLDESNDEIRDLMERSIAKGRKEHRARQREAEKKKREEEEEETVPDLQ